METRNCFFKAWVFQLNMNHWIKYGSANVSFCADRNICQSSYADFPYLLEVTWKFHRLLLRLNVNEPIDPQMVMLLHHGRDSIRKWMGKHIYLPSSISYILPLLSENLPFGLFAHVDMTKRYNEVSLSIVLFS